MSRLSKTRIGLLCIGCLCAISLWAQGQAAPPPMRTGNGSELELKNLSWPREGQLPTVIHDNTLMQRKLTDHLEPISLQVMQPTTLFPENPSEFMMNVILLHAVRDSIAGLHDETIARMNKMLAFDHLFPSGSATAYSAQPYFPWMMGGSRGFSGGAGIAYVGLLDPVEIYRNWKRRKQEARTQLVLMTLFGDDARLLTKAETDSIRREEERIRNLPITPVDNPTPISVVLQNDTVVAPSKPKFTAPLFGKERPALPLDSLSEQ